MKQKSAQANKEVAENEERFRALVTATSDVVYRMNADWTEMRHLKNGGSPLDRGEAIHDWMERYIYAGDREKVLEAIRQAMDTKGIFQLEYQVQRADGTIGWTSSRAVPILDNDGEIIEWFGAANDVTARKQTEKALSEAKNLAEQQKRLYETITASTPDLIYVFDLNYKFTYANEALLTMWGKTWDNAIGKSLLDNGYESWHAEMHEREIDKVAETKTPIRGEVSFPHAQFGRRIYDYIFTPVFNDKGEVEAVAGTTRDITDIRLAEISLGESEARFRNMAEGTNIYIVMTDETGKALYFNQAWSKLTGKSMNDLIGYHWTELVHPDDREKHREIYRKAIETEAPVHSNFRLQAKDGQYRWLLVDSSVRRYNDGSFAGYIGAAVDITELKEDEQRKNDFISMVSHELKTPLTSTLAYIQISKAKAADNNDEFTVGMLERTEKQVRKMTAMINSFLNMSRLESGKIQIDREQFDIAELIKEIEEETRATVTTHQVLFAPVTKTLVMGDYDKIGQVIQNYISNATKYSARNSTIEVQCDQIDGNIRVSVRDQGIGIRKEDLPRLFERFYRVREIETRNISGFGIGLYLCAEVIKRHNGKIWAESKLGEGSTFYFTLPSC